MPKRRDQEPTLAPQDQLYRAMGLGRTKLRILYTTSLVLTLALIATQVERYLLTSRLRAQVYVVTTDPAGNVGEVARATSAWEPGDGVWVHVAQQWLRNVRARPMDANAWEAQKHEVSVASTRDLWPAINAWMIDAREEFRRTSVQMEIIKTTLVGQPRADGATVDIRWRERALMPSASADDWAYYSGTLTLAKRPPLTTGEIAENPLGIYVTHYSFQQEKI